MVEAGPPERARLHDERVGAPVGRAPRRPGRRPRPTRAIDEAVAVAAAEGATLDPSKVIAELLEAHATLSSPMARDIEAGREPELDVIVGSVLRAADRHEIPVPTIESLARAVARRAGVPLPRRLAPG